MSLREQCAPSSQLGAACTQLLLPCYYFPSAKEKTDPEKDTDSHRVTQLGSKNLHIWTPEPRAYLHVWVPEPRQKPRACI